MALTFIGQSVASAIIGNVVNKCFSYLNAVPVASGVQDELDRLQKALPQVEAVLTAVEEGAWSAMMQNKGLRVWLWQLRDAVEDAEDVLDELEYYELEKRIRDGDDKVHGNSFFECKIKNDSFIKGRLKEAVKNLNMVIDRMVPFIQIASGFYGPSVKRRKLEEVKNARETSSLLTESEVFGRDNEREMIVEWLIKPVDGESEGITFNVSAYTIVGMGGFGKTTLAQLIHQDERVQRYFDPIMWVCVSQDFNVAAIMRKMLKDENSGESLDALHEDLKQKLTSHRFLLILDDVWNEDNMSKWEKLVAPLKFGQRGSKILLTTRMVSVADMAARVMEYKRESFDLKELEESDCMSLFNKHAFLGVNPDDYKNLQPIGEQIAKKLGGCPLVIKVMGGLLNSCKDYEYWKRILKEDTMKLQQEKDSIMTVLRLSYDHLPTNLRVCFRYCSIFPQDYQFKRKKLVYMWMGSGLISQSICGGRSPEDIGREYLDLLTRKSFFTYNKIYKRYVMHDLMHNLAQFVSLGECIRIRGDVVGNTIPRTVRHLSFETINLHSIEEIPNLKNLRTLVISDKGRHKQNEDYLPVFNKVINGFKTLRLLSLRVSFKYNKLPDALDSLIHLRYLSISSYLTTYQSFHFQSLYRLYHLVVMKLTFQGIPPMNIEYDGFTNLVNLRSLDLPKSVIKKIPYLSKLPSIRKLEEFFVREKSGYKISELENLRDLRGHLSIRRLENVRSSEEAIEAKLEENEYLKSLTLEWSKRRSNNVKTDEQLLDNLCPHINLKSLRIEEYQGVKSPYWMTDQSHINLTFIELSGCKGLVHLPPLGGLPSLNGLRMTGLHSVKQIGCSFYGCGGGCAFPSLKELDFELMPNLEEWIGIDDCCMFPKLHTMTIAWCPNLKGLPALPRCLKNLQIEDVGLTTLPAINENCGNHNQQEQFLADQALTIVRCKKLQYLSKEVFQKFNTIEVLRILYCPKLEWIGIDDCCMFPKLHTMTITRCPNLKGLPALPRCLNKLQIEDVGLTTLPTINENCGSNNQQKQFLDPKTTLIIKNCEKLQYLPTEFFQKFNTIEVLTIRNCPKLEEWIGIDDGCMFPKLRTMTIYDCPNLRGIPTLPQCLNKLEIEDVGLTTLPAINENCRNNNQQEQFSALETLTITECEKLQYLPTEFFKKFNTIKHLKFRNLPNLEWIGIDDCCMFAKLRTMKIINCPNLSGLLTLPCSLTNLYISNVGLTALQAIDENCGNNNLQDHFQGLEYLTIEQCDKLEYIPTEFFQKFNTVKFLKIEKCPKLTTLGISDIRPPSVLNEIFIGSCGDFEVSFMWSANLTSLTKLKLHSCASITSLPPAQVCARWTMLSCLEIVNCKELSSFGGIQALVSLHELEIRGCDELIEVALRQPPFPNDVSRRNAADCVLKLGKLSIDHHALLLMEPLRSLSSISSFTISDALRLTSLPEEWLLQNHSALKELHIWDACFLRSLPQSMTQLCSLECLIVLNGELIQSLPDLPTSLHSLRIRGCHPELKERCQENIGLDWPKIANIPNVWIYN